MKAFGWAPPEFVHLSIFLKPSGKGKMSKREAAQTLKDGFSIFLGDLQNLGYLPEGVANWIALMGWSYDDRTEFFTLADLIEKFSLERLNPSPAAINFTKLDHFNGLHIRSLSPEDLAGRVRPFLEAAGYSVDPDRLLRIAPIIQERLVTLDDAVQMAGFFFQAEVHPEPADLAGAKMSPAESAAALRRAYDLIAGVDDIKLETVEPCMRLLADELGLSSGQLFGMIRVAVTGQRVSPPLFQSLEIIGKPLTLQRLEQAIVLLNEMA
ncbi:MAG: glutamate--tRNA ligase family protein [Anaerolineales bacterium]|nr:glutamate--tRNA ligase family protein [Anaerolineales bacterium]